MMEIRTPTIYFDLDGNLASVFAHMTDGGTKLTVNGVLPNHEGGESMMAVMIDHPMRDDAVRHAINVIEVAITRDPRPDGKKCPEIYEHCNRAIAMVRAAEKAIREC